MSLSLVISEIYGLKDTRNFYNKIRVRLIVYLSSLPLNFLSIDDLVKIKLDSCFFLRIFATSILSSSETISGAISNTYETNKQINNLQNSVIDVFVFACWCLTYHVLVCFLLSIVVPIVRKRHPGICSSLSRSWNDSTL